MVNHVSFCLAYDNLDKILNPAPQQYWNKYYFYSEKSGKAFKLPDEFLFD